MIDCSTAILLFSRTPVAEAAAKQLTGGRLADISLFTYLYNHAYKIAVKSGLPVIAYDEQWQHGSSFGEKITYALEETFAKGYANIIVIGNDCIQLTQQHIHKAYQEMQAGKQVVAGPDKRGGLYLFGINRKAFSSDAFRAFHWQTNCLIKDFKKYSEGYSSSFIISKADINHLADLVNSCQFFSVGSAWLRLLRGIIRLNHSVCSFIPDNYYFVYRNTNIPLRAPPSF